MENMISAVEAAMIEKIFGCKGIKDGHNFSRPIQNPPKFIGIHIHEKEITPIYTPEWARGFCVNPLYLDKEGYAVIDPCSVGGTLSLAGRSIEEATERYNKEHDGSHPGCMKMHLSLYRQDADGTIVRVAG